MKQNYPIFRFALTNLPEGKKIGETFLFPSAPEEGQFCLIYFSCFSTIVYFWSLRRLDQFAVNIYHFRFFPDPGLEEIRHHSSICRLLVLQIIFILILLPCILSYSVGLGVRPTRHWSNKNSGNNVLCRTEVVFPVDV